MLVGCVYFFNQNTADESRISDWSSYLCSSDLAVDRGRRRRRREQSGVRSRSDDGDAQHGRRDRSPGLAADTAAADGAPGARNDDHGGAGRGFQSGLFAEAAPMSFDAAILDHHVAPLRPFLDAPDVTELVINPPFEVGIEGRRVGSWEQAEGLWAEWRGTWISGMSIR